MLGLVLAAVLDPRLASWAGALLSGRPDLGPVLVEICERESGCKMVGPHRVDSHRSAAAWRDAVELQRVMDPQTCRHHRLDAGPWSTSGAWGMMRAFTLHRLGCWPAWVLDVPLVGALAAVRRIEDPRCRAVWGCARWAGWARIPHAAASSRVRARS